MLVVDDAPAIVKMTSLMLKKMGHKVSSAENGLMAVEAVVEQWQQRREKFDLILMDLQMPVMDGLESMKRIRMFEEEQAAAEWLEPAYGHQLIIGLSANSDSDAMESALECGADAFLSKPFTVDAFRKTLQKIMLNRD